MGSKQQVPSGLYLYGSVGKNSGYRLNFVGTKSLCNVGLAKIIILPDSYMTLT